VFITLRGELPKYMGFLLSTPVPAGGAKITSSPLADITPANAAQAAIAVAG